jgi:hypothetical protein
MRPFGFASKVRLSRGFVVFARAEWGPTSAASLRPSARRLYRSHPIGTLPNLGQCQQSDATRLRVSQSAYDCLVIAGATPKAKAKRRIVVSLFAACDRPDGPVPVFALA